MLRVDRRLGMCARNGTSSSCSLCPASKQAA
jgi:hypothetical protein